MIFCCESNFFTKCLTMICSVVPRKSTIVSFTQAKITSKDGKLKLSGTDTESMIEIDLSEIAKPMTNFDFLFSAHELLDYVKLLEGVIKFDLNNGFFKASVKGSSQSFPIFPASDFMDSNYWKVRTECEELLAGPLIQGIESCLKFASKERPPGADASGVYLEAENGKVYLTGIDGISALVVEITEEDEVGDIRQTMIPPYACSALLKIKFDHTRPLNFKFPASHLPSNLVVFEQDHIWAAFRSVELNTASIKNKMKKESFIADLEVNSGAIQKSLERVSTCTKNEDNKNLLVSLTSSEEGQNLSMLACSFVSKKTASDCCRAENVNGEFPFFTVNSKRFFDLCSVADGVIKLRKPQSNCLYVLHEKNYQKSLAKYTGVCQLILNQEAG